MLIRVFYVSEIVEPFTTVDLQMILGEAQVNNRRLDITGMLAQSDGHFAQVLEGRADVMPPLLARIGADRRHREVRFVLQESIERRQFARWAMGLIRRDDMAEQMRLLHRDGCDNNAHARRLIEMLMYNVES